jgi:chromosome segregation ATPase
MNYQEASIELEKLTKLFKALEHADSVINTLANADAYKVELTNKIETLKLEVADLQIKKSEAELNLNTLFLTKSVEADKLVKDAEKEVLELKVKSKQLIDSKLVKAEQEASSIVSKAYSEAAVLESQIKDLQVQKVATQQELKDLETKLQSVKTQITKLLGN